MKRVIFFCALLAISGFSFAQGLVAIDSAGRVGIGTSAPAWELDILGRGPGEGAILQIGDDDRSHFVRFYSGRNIAPDPFVNWTSGTSLRFLTTTNDFSGYAEHMRLTGDGRLGIGTVAPMAALDVVGDVRVDAMPVANTVDSVVVRMQDGKLALREVSTLSKPRPFYLGQDTMGGIVFHLYIDSAGQQRGLMVSKLDTFIRLNVQPSINTETTTWDGASNTLHFGFGNGSVRTARDWLATHFSSEWYIPSIDELTLLRQNLWHVNKAFDQAGLYFGPPLWSSTAEDTVARLIYFVDWQIDFVAIFASQPTRAVRAF